MHNDFSLETLIEPQKNTQQLYLEIERLDSSSSFALESFHGFVKENSISQEGIGNFASAIVRGIIKFFKAIWDFFKRIFNYIKTKMKSLWDSLFGVEKKWKAERAKSQEKLNEKIKSANRSVKEAFDILMKSAEGVNESYDKMSKFEGDEYQYALREVSDLQDRYNSGGMSSEEFQREADKLTKKLGPINEKYSDLNNEIMGVAEIISTESRRYSGGDDLSIDKVEDIFGYIKQSPKLLKEYENIQRKTARMEDNFMKSISRHIQSSREDSIEDFSISRSYIDIIKNLRRLTTSIIKNAVSLNTKTITSFNKSVMNIIDPGNWNPSDMEMEFVA